MGGATCSSLFQVVLAAHTRSTCSAHRRTAFHLALLGSHLRVADEVWQRLAQEAWLGLEVGVKHGHKLVALGRQRLHALQTDTHSTRSSREAQADQAGQRGACQGKAEQARG